MLQAAYVPYAIHDLGLDASGVGVTLACYGVGMIVGALLAPRVVGVNFPVAVSLWCVVLGFGLQAVIISASKVRTLKRLPESLAD